MRNKGRSKIIIADDSMFIVRQLTQIMMSGGYTITESVLNGIEAVDSYKRHYPEVKLITLDITMPGMTGIEALELILEFDPEATVVMVSTLGTERLVRKSLVAGAKGYILKPLKRDRVLKRLVKAME